MKKYIIALSITAVLSSCSQYQKTLKSEDKAKKYELGTELFNKGKYNKAIRLYEQVTGTYRGRPSGEALFYRLSKAYYETKQYYLAAEQFKSFINGYPTSEKREEAMFLRGKAYTLVSPVYSQDQSDTYLAIETLQAFIDAYPDSEQIAEANQLMENMTEKLERKAFEIANQYNTIGEYTRNYNASIVAIDNFLIDYPGSKYKEDALFSKFDSLYKLAINSVEDKKEERLRKAADAYNAFIESYTDSKYKNKADNMIETVNNELEKYSN
ncbi:outer membrane protein assembly factor BamD [Flavobacterium agricola]|uniref:Type IV secretion system putative lipoprotein virB7 n=1 Tax=Flavobacterium agricola TaxID=2870839 RepID=A0ABY6M0Y0_9FLAO|nr:outer membrane protein assembly factor BamD [Flavobacterium agricola]UYW02159.1 outer membrane protein assembly factor BamD [Flavobacterium agricola]